jgi:hypothetical protein
MAKVVSMAKAIEQKEEEKQALRLLKELKSWKTFCENSGDKLQIEDLGFLVKSTLEWWAM